MQSFTTVLSITDEQRQQIAEGAEVRVTVNLGDDSMYVEVQIAE